MLGVLKRRWKPKRGVSNNNINNINNNNNATRRQSKTDSSMQVDIARTATSPRAIHPVVDEKAALVVAYGLPPLAGGGDEAPCTEAAPGGGGVYPLQPNICVEAGRIEFIKPTQDSATSPNLEKSDPAKEWLERRVAQLEEALEEERKGIQRERMLTAKLQRQISRREVAQRDVDRERRLRCESEARLRSSVSEADRCRTRLASLQKEFTRMEDTVRSMLQYKSKYELLKHEKASLTLAFESKVQQFQSALNKLSHENEQLKKQLRTFEAAGGGKVVERLQELERDNSALSQEGEVQRRQYERCLDDVANQVVRALLAQKGLREEIGSLHRKIKDLETQNRALSSLLIQQLQGATPVTPCSLLASSQDKQTKATVTLALPGGGRSRGRPVSCDEARLRALLVGGGGGVLGEDGGGGTAVVWLPIQRPRSLNLDASCCQYRAHRVASNTASRPPLLTSPLTGGSGLKKSGEDEGSESPESGNRDEGYSTMSSDVQGPLEAPRRGLEDLKEATDETESATMPIDRSTSPADRILDVPETSDLVLIPLSVAVAAQTRHSFPAVEELLPFQHIMRSFSDSHLCLKLTPNSPSPSYSLTSAESLFLFGDKSQQPLRRSRATTSLLCTAVQEEEDDSGSWSSVDNWDTDYIQHWLRLDETRSQLQQQMEYDAAELEDWTMEETEFWKRCEAITPNQSHLPSIQETNASELEEDANECLWNGSSYLVDMSSDGNELMGRCLWPTSARCLISPGGDSWSSVGTNSEDSKSCNDNCQNGSKRSSTAMSTDSGESPAVGTDFTRDFYRLVKFESTKSLASTSSRGDNVGLKRQDLSFSSDREQALQSVLHFIAEQQQYCLSREVQDHPSDGLDVSPVKSVTNDENENRNNELVEGLMSVDETLESKLCMKPNECCDTTKISPESSTNVGEDEEGKVAVLNENVELKRPTLVSDDFSNDGINDCLDLRHKDMESSAITNEVDCDVNSCCNVRLGSKEQILPNDISCRVSDSNSDKKSVEEVVEPQKEVQKEVRSRDSLLEQPSLIPRLIRPELMPTKSTFLGPVPEEDEDHCSVSTTDSTPKSPQLPKSPEPKRASLIPKSSQIPKSPESKRVFRRPLESSSSGPSTEASVLVGDSNALGFHERASSKDVIDELNRMIRKGEDSAEVETSSTVTNLDMGCCCPTGWVHVERDIDFTDPKARANLLDVMLAASHSSSSADSTSDGGGNSSDSEADEPPDYQHLHRIHRFRRQKKASANREPLGALRCTSSAPRPSIIGRDDFFVRYGEKEREAVASFDFLEELSTTSISGASSCDNNPPSGGASGPGGDSPPLSRSQSQTPDPDAPEHLSLSDSCAGSFSGSELSLENH